MKNSTNKIRLHKAVCDLVKKTKQEYTNPEVQKNITSLGVMLNEELVYNRLEWVYAFDKISINHWPVRTHGDFDKIKIIFQDESCWVFYKPSGIAVESGAGHTTNNLINWVLENFPNQKKLDKESRFGLVHRLDKDTEGLILIAKSESSYHYYKILFKNRQIKKKYYAIVEGLLDSRINITSYNTRDKQTPTRQRGFFYENEARLYDKNYKEAISILTPIIHCSNTNKTLIEIELVTGRMHQIRLHCEMLLRPIVGDTKYNQKSRYLQTKPNIISSKTEFKTLVSNECEKNITMIFDPVSFYLLSNRLDFTSPDNTKHSILYIDKQSLK